VLGLVTGGLGATLGASPAGAAAATKLVFTSTPADATAGVPFSITVKAEDNSNVVDTGYTGTVHFTKSDSGAGSALPANYIFVTGDNGSRTFTNGVTLVTAGDQTVTATDTVTSSITGTATVDVMPSTATHFQVTAPSAASVGTSFNFTVTALDQFGNTATGYTGTVRFTTGDAGSALPANFTFSGANAGIANFSATFGTAGNPETITATDTSNSSITGTSGPIDVVTGAIPPADTVSGVTFSGSSVSGGATNTTWTVGFTTSDPNGELVPGDHISVTFPAGFAIPLNPTVTLGSGFFGCTASPQATAVTSGQTVVITLGTGCQLDASTAATVTIAGITNPAAATYANTSFLVSTSADFAASPAAAVVITGGAPVASSCLGSTGNAAFLCLAYEDLLGRAPDAGGLATFEGLLAAGVSRAQVAYDIATSPERHSDVVQFYYDALLGRPADPGGLASWVGVLNAGWSDQQVLEGIMGSAEFYAHAGGTPSGFVTALYADLLGRGPDSGGLASWVGAVNAGVSRGAVVAGFLYSSEGETRFVEGEYATLLDRAADSGGLATWVSALAHGTSYEQVIAGIMGSPEFYGLSQ